MGDPDLYSDETIRLTAENIVVKSAPFEAILTNKRIILVDSRKKHIPQQTILLATLRHAEMSENAIRDPVITLSILTNTGSTRQMVLTFSKKSGERKRECEEWIKILRDYAASSTQTVSHRVTPAPEPQPQPEPEPDVTTPPQIRMTSGSAVKKKIEIARPIKKIIETGPVPPKPIETSTLPEGAFCSKCGSRVPVGSAFCNRCGSKVILPGDQGTVPAPVAPEVPAPVVQTTPAPPVVPATPPVTDSTPPVPSVTAQVTAPETSPVAPIPPPVIPVVHEHAVRPIEQIIHSIEPLIEDSVPRTEPNPLIVREFPIPFPTLPTSSTGPETPAPATVPSTDASPGTPGGAVAPAAPGTPSVGGTLPPVPPVLPPVPGIPGAAKRRRNMTIAAIVIVLLVIAAGVFIVMKPMQGAVGVNNGSITVTPTVTPSSVTPTATTSPTRSPTVTTTVTSLPTTMAGLEIPKEHVWLRITYPQTYTGTYGPPGQQVTDTGDHFYQISTEDGTVVASITKQDGSADKLTVGVYKNGVLFSEESTTRPRGSVDFQAILKTPTPTPVPTTIATTVVTTVTPVVNATVTVNTTQTVVT